MTLVQPQQVYFDLTQSCWSETATRAACPTVRLWLVPQKQSSMFQFPLKFLNYIRQVQLVSSELRMYFKPHIPGNNSCTWSYRWCVLQQLFYTWFLTNYCTHLLQFEKRFIIKHQFRYSSNTGKSLKGRIKRQWICRQYFFTMTHLFIYKWNKPLQFAFLPLNTCLANPTWKLEIVAGFIMV